MLWLLDIVWVLNPNLRFYEKLWPALQMSTSFPVFPPTCSCRARNGGWVGDEPGNEVVRTWSSPSTIKVHVKEHCIIVWLKISQLVIHIPFWDANTRLYEMQVQALLPLFPAPPPYPQEGQCSQASVWFSSIIIYVQQYLMIDLDPLGPYLKQHLQGFGKTSWCKTGQKQNNNLIW